MKFLLFCLGSISLFAKPLQMQVSARSAILMNADTGAILYEKHPNLPHPPASITKIATALYVLDRENLNLDQILTASANALKIKPSDWTGEYPPYWDEVAGTKMGLVKGEKLPLDVLLYGLMRMSGNDAANVIAEHFAPSIPDFVQELNQYIRSLGCKGTNFCNPHGLHLDDHYTTAYDMAIITKRALKFPKFREYVSNSVYKKPKTNMQAAATQNMRHSNRFIQPGKEFYPKAIGVKIGYHSKAQFTFVGAAEHEGRVLIAVLLGCAKKNENRYADAARLFELAFAEKKETKVFFTPQHLFSYSIEGAKTALDAVLPSDLAISYFPSEEPTCRAFVLWEKNELPILKGQKVGRVQICDAAGVVLQERDLAAKDSVNPTYFHTLKKLLGF